MTGNMSKFSKSKQKQSGEDKTQVVQNEQKCSNLPYCQKARRCGLLQYFGYQSVIRLVTEARTGNSLRIQQSKSEFYVVIHSVLHNKERL